MLPHPTHDRLIALGLVGMAKAFEEQRAQPAVASLTFEERLGLLVDREAVERESKRLVTRLKFANLRQNATIEDLNTKAARGLDKALFAKLATGDWITRRQDLLITGKTGTGKSWLACALAHKACRDDRSVLYYRVAGGCCGRVPRLSHRCVPCARWRAGDVSHCGGSRRCVSAVRLAAG